MTAKTAASQYLFKLSHFANLLVLNCFVLQITNLDSLPLFRNLGICGVGVALRSHLHHFDQIQDNKFFFSSLLKPTHDAFHPSTYYMASDVASKGSSLLSGHLGSLECKKLSNSILRACFACCVPHCLCVTADCRLDLPFPWKAVTPGADHCILSVYPVASCTCYRPKTNSEMFFSLTQVIKALGSFIFRFPNELPCSFPSCTFEFCSHIKLVKVTLTTFWSSGQEAIYLIGGST